MEDKNNNFDLIGWWDGLDIKNKSKILTALIMVSVILFFVFLKYTVFILMFAVPVGVFAFICNGIYHLIYDELSYRNRCR